MIGPVHNSTHTCPGLSAAVQLVAPLRQHHHMKHRNSHCLGGVCKSDVVDVLRLGKVDWAREQHTCMPRAVATAAAELAPSNVRSSRSAQYTHSVTLDLHSSQATEPVCRLDSSSFVEPGHKFETTRLCMVCMHFEPLEHMAAGTRCAKHLPWFAVGNSVGLSAPVIWSHNLPRQRGALCCGMCFAESPQSNRGTLYRQLLKVNTAGSQRGHKQPVDVL